MQKITKQDVKTIYELCRLLCKHEVAVNKAKNAYRWPRREIEELDTESLPTWGVSTHNNPHIVSWDTTGHTQFFLVKTGDFNGWRVVERGEKYVPPNGDNYVTFY